MTEIRTRGRQDALELDAGHHVGIGSEAIFPTEPGVKHFKPGRCNDGAHFNAFFGIGVVMVDGPGDAGFDALVTLGADAAGETPVGFPDGLVLAETDPHFLERGSSFVRFHIGIFLPGNLGNLGGIPLVRQVFRPVLGAARGNILPLQVTAYGDGRFLTGVDGLDDRGRTGDDVAAGENARHIGGKRYGIDVKGVPFIDGDAASLGHKVQIRRLTDSGNDCVAFDDEFGTFDRKGPASAAGVRFTQLHTEALDSRKLSVFADDANRGHQEFHLDPFFQGLLDFFGGRRHFRAGAAIKNKYVLGAGADGRPDSVHGDVPAADDGDTVTQENLLAQIDAPQIIDAVNDPLHVLAGDVQFAGEDRPAADEDGVVVLLKLLKGKIFADRGVEVNLDAQVLDDPDFRLEDVLRKTVFGNADSEPAAGNRQGFENVHTVALCGQIVGSRQTRRTGADNSNFFIFFLFYLGDVPGLVLEIQVRHEAFQMHDVDGRLHLAPHTGLFTGMVTDAAADRGEGVVFFDKLEGFPVLTRRDQGHIALDADMGGTGRLAGRRPELVDGVTAGNRLGEMPISGFAFA